MEQARISDSIRFERDEELKKQAPLPISTPTKNRIELLPFLNPHFWVIQSIPEGRANRIAKDTCIAGEKVR
jgi:hypothetical protein